MDTLQNTAKELLPGDYTIEEMHFTDGTNHKRAVHRRDYREFDGGYRVNRYIVHEGNDSVTHQTVVTYEGVDDQ